MFDIGFWELTVVAVVALLVIGPDKLPEVARTAGTWVGRARRFIAQVKDDVNLELRQEEIKKALEREAGLDEIKQIMNTDQFSLEDDNSAQYQLDAIADESPQQPLPAQQDEYDDLSGDHAEYEPADEEKMSSPASDNHHSDSNGDETEAPHDVAK